MPAGWPASHRHQNDSPNISDNIIQEPDTADVVLNPPSSVVGKAPRSFREQILDNQFLTAGAGLVALTGGLAVARKSVVLLSEKLVKFYTITLEIPIRDRSYSYFLNWMHNHQRKLVAQNVSLYSSTSAANQKPISLLRSPVNWAINKYRPRMHELSVSTNVETLPNGASLTEFSLFPGIGNHIFRYRTAFMKMSRTRELKNLDPQGIPWEVISLTTLYSQRHLFQELLNEAHELAMTEHEGKTVIYTGHMIDWKPFGQPRKKRPLESVVLDQGVKETILNDVHEFLGSAKWYTDRGIPYRRGYLLHGPPGSGKSSFIQALAGEMDYNICIVNLSERGLTDDRLNHLLSNIPKRSIVLLEDVDAAFSNRRQADETGYAGANVTFSGLLNAIDGVASSEERIMFLTTNHVDRLDEALMRPGRVDLEMRLGQATEWQVARMFERFYFGHDNTEALRDEFVKTLKDAGVFEEGHHGISTAQLQGLFVYFKRAPEEAVKNAGLLITKK